MSEEMDNIFDKHIGQRYWDSMKSHFEQLEKMLDEIVEEMTEEHISVWPAWSKMFGSHVLP